MLNNDVGSELFSVFAKMKFSTDYGGMALDDRENKARKKITYEEKSFDYSAFK